MATRSGILVHHSFSDDGIIDVVDDNRVRSLYFGNNTKQSSMDLDMPERLVLSYTRAMVAGMLFMPVPRSVLVIGLGGGSLVRFLNHHFPECQIDCVECREDVVKVAVGYFRLPDTPLLQFNYDDGARFVQDFRLGSHRYDLILVDAYNPDGMAESVKEIEFFKACRNRLSNDGIFSINLWEHREDGFFNTTRNLERAFEDNVLLLPVEERGNTIILAAKNPNAVMRLRGVKERAQALEEKTGIEFPRLLRQLKRHNRWRSLAKLF